jgi:hypothetical protein
MGVATSYAVFGIKRKMPTQENEYCGSQTPVLPNGRLLNRFGGILSEGELNLEGSLNLMGEEGKFLVGYQLAYLDHHGALEIGRSQDPQVRTELLRELREAGMSVDDAEPKLYLHMDSDQYEHC